MKSKYLKSIFKKLNSTCSIGLEHAVLFSETRTHREVRIEHYILKILEQDNTELEQILNYFKVDINVLWSDLVEILSSLRANSVGAPTFSEQLNSCLEKAIAASLLYYNRDCISSVSILDAILEIAASDNSQAFKELDIINLEELRENHLTIIDKCDKYENNLDTDIATNTSSSFKMTSNSALERFTENLTQKALNGLIDPVLGRTNEIRLMIDILIRRRKNNPILVGEPGVGKTALVEGLALKISNKQVPSELLNTSIHTIDLGLLQAGAGVKGEFEKRLKQVVREIKESISPIILFIDEAHTLIGSGGEAGMSDAANILKPSLARGELRTIAATTWSEYKKYFERDAALERRFQMVKVDEPSVENAIQMLTGLKKIYEKHHEIRITDDAIDAAVKLSNRYINARYLPDKAIDLIDTAAARIKINQSNIPASIEVLDSQTQYIVKRINNLKNDNDRGIPINISVIDTLNNELEKVRDERDSIYDVWLKESNICNQLQEIQNELEQEFSSKNSSKAKVANLKGNIKKLRLRLSEYQGQYPLTSIEVNADEVSKIISDWTGIPIGNMLKDDISLLLDLEKYLSRKIKGQDGALNEIAKSLQSQKAGLNDMNSPLGVFLFTGPTGVGKTETARVLSDILFGGERFLITINMSEYQESHSVSQLKGAPPGYVGYGEGGILTEAVRQRPYSVVLLDEIEKAHPDVLNMFYQVFERGFMRDGEGREIDFKNTIIIMTSNVGSESLLNIDDNDNPKGSYSILELSNIIYNELITHFPVAMLARMQVVPYVALNENVLSSIALNKMNEISSRIFHSHAIKLVFEKSFLDLIVSSNAISDTGARSVNAFIENKITPEISKSILCFMVEGNLPDSLCLKIDDGNNLSLIFSDISSELEGKDDSHRLEEELTEVL